MEEVVICRYSMEQVGTVYRVDILCRLEVKLTFQSDIRRIFEFIGTQQGVYRVTRYLSGYSRKPCPAGVIALRSRAILKDGID